MSGAKKAARDLSNWTKARIEDLSSKELGAIIRSTKPDGKFAREIAWAKAELLRRSGPALLDQTRLLERCLVYEIRKAELDGDDEGATLKSMTLHLCRDVIAKATGERTP